MSIHALFNTGIIGIGIAIIGLIVYLQNRADESLYWVSVFIAAVGGLALFAWFLRMIGG